MFFVILLEVPVSIFVLKQFHILPLVVNTVIPPIMMTLIVGITMPPSTFNTSLILNRLIDIINSDASYEKKVVLIINPKKGKKASLGHIIFSTIYVAIFLLVFGGIFSVLRLLNFNVISVLIFFFFISVVTFFGYRIRIISRQYSLETKTGFLSHIFDLIFLPILSVGKVLSSQLSKINVFIIIFDVLLEMPFKTFIEVLEAWMNYARRRKEDIA